MRRSQPCIYPDKSFCRWRKGPVYRSQAKSFMQSSNRKSKMFNSEKRSMMLAESNLFRLWGPWLCSEVKQASISSHDVASTCLQSPDLSMSSSPLQGVYLPQKTGQCGRQLHSIAFTNSQISSIQTLLLSLPTLPHIFYLLAVIFCLSNSLSLLTIELYSSNMIFYNSWRRLENIMSIQYLFN